MNNILKSEQNVKRLDSALAYSRLNLFVLPLFSPTTTGECSCGNPKCSSIGKHPRISGGVNSASIDEEVIRDWWERHPDANIGIATGRKSNIVVFDFDFPKGGKRVFDDFIKKNDGPFRTPTVKTGNGIHLYFEAPDSSIKNSEGILPGVDVRGDGGYVVAPPSLHENGNHYEWKIKIERRKL